MTTKILMVCLGNICRSPTAEAALRHAAAEAGVDVEVDSAGTAAYHVGEPADPRMVDAASGVGMALTSVARQVADADFADFDLIVAMDRSNLEELRRRAPDEAALAKLRLLRDFTDEPGTDVPDPYYGGPEGFAEVVRIVRDGARGILASLPAGSR
ncbi:low molecular weight protein-tyrosine-phosphatase [Euzebya sp.]|uniref:low molecular weight protein-tyrosine-phosphatase n=1 Tax=Euzebya sp. TaxID=1971409 RepID=UPI003510E63C